VSPPPIAGKDVFTNSTDQICNGKVMTGSVGDILEVFEVHLESPLSAEERCGQATELAKEVEKRLPDE